MCVEDIPYYRKVPTKVQAVQFTDFDAGELIREWSRDNFSAIHPDDRGGDPELIAEVHDAIHSTWIGVRLGDWIIKGVKGEFYPCDPEVFAATYEVAE